LLEVTPPHDTQKVLVVVPVDEEARVKGMKMRMRKDRKISQ